MRDGRRAARGRGVGVDLWNYVRGRGDDGAPASRVRRRPVGRRRQNGLRAGDPY